MSFLDIYFTYIFIGLLWTLSRSQVTYDMPCVHLSLSNLSLISVVFTQQPILVHNFLDS